MSDTKGIRDEVHLNKHGQAWLMRTALILMCDILDELRTNARNREKALQNYAVTPK